VVADLERSHPAVSVVINEYEPLEVFDLLVDDDLDLGLTYDYDLAPASMPEVLVAAPLWTAPWGLGVPATSGASDRADLVEWGRLPWIVNSRNTADAEAVRTLGKLAGFSPRISHSIDSLDLVEDLIESGHGVGLLPLDRPSRSGVRVLPLPDPGVLMTAYAVTRLGRQDWPPLRLVLDRLTERHAW
jgi:DNA-binding transcriptional LysR family regulator